MFYLTKPKLLLNYKNIYFYSYMITILFHEWLETLEKTKFSSFFLTAIILMFYK